MHIFESNIVPIIIIIFFQFPIYQILSHDLQLDLDFP